jgi:hypothetical protein
MQRGVLASHKRATSIAKFCQKWGPHADGGINYVIESKREFDIGRALKKSDAYI